MRNSANNRPLTQPRPVTRTLTYHGPLAQPPSPPATHLLTQSIVIKLQ
jgi:hypothetical protein